MNYHWVWNLIDFQLISQGFGQGFNWFLKDGVRTLIDLQNNFKRFGKDSNRFEKEFLRIW